MKTNRMLIGIACVLTVSFLIIGCGGKYSDAEKLNMEFVELMEEYIADLDKADNAKDVAKAMNNYADGMEDLWPKMQKVAEKYPELKDKSNPPEELKESQQKANEVSQKMAGSMMKTMQYMRDPEVRKAQQRLGKIMINK
jgi:hypothetical protein